MLARSYRTWSSYSKEAQLQDGLQPASVHLRNILDRVPAYLANTFTQCGLPAQLKLEQQTSKSSNSELFISGRSTWHTSEIDCDLRDKIIHYQLLFGTQLSTTCTFADDSRFANWPGIQGEPENLTRGNYLAILAFAGHTFCQHVGWRCNRMQLRCRFLWRGMMACSICVTRRSGYLIAARYHRMSSRLIWVIWIMTQRDGGLRF